MSLFLVQLNSNKTLFWCHFKSLYLYLYLYLCLYSIPKRQGLETKVMEVVDGFMAAVMWCGLCRTDWTLNPLSHQKDFLSSLVCAKQTFNVFVIVFSHIWNRQNCCIFSKLSKAILGWNPILCLDWSLYKWQNFAPRSRTESYSETFDSQSWSILYSFINSVFWRIFCSYFPTLEQIDSKINFN